MRVLLVGVGSARDVRAFSGTPHFMLAAARAAGEPWEDVDLDVATPAWRRRRYAWNLRSILSGRGRGGYQFTDEFLERLRATARVGCEGAHLLNWTQLYPSSLLDDSRVRRSYFIDQTLGQLFDGYGVGARIRPDVARDALDREARGYRSAHAVIVHSAWARQGVLDVGDVDPAQVHVVVPGANLDAAAYDRWAATHRPSRRRVGDPLRLVFVGRHPVRKGLDRLLSALRLAREAGSDVQLDVVGTLPDEVDVGLRDVDGVRWHGRIDKARELDRFIAIVSSADVGCLLSRAEAGGIGLREYHALGLAVVGPDVGGSPDHALAGASVLVRPDADEATIAQLLLDLAADPDRTNTMKQDSWSRREEVLWRASVARIAHVL